MKKESLMIISLLISLLLLPQLATAFSLGVSPATESLEGSPRDTVQAVFTVSTDSEMDLSIEPSAEGDMKKWITFTSSDLKVSKSKPLEITANFKIPRFAKKKGYTDILTFSTKLPGVEPSGTGSTVVTAVAVKVSMNVMAEGDLVEEVIELSNEEDTEGKSITITGAASGVPPAARTVDKGSSEIIAISAVVFGLIAALMILLIAKVTK